MIAVATVAGPLLRGILIQADVAGMTWRMIFLVNVPLALAAIPGAASVDGGAASAATSGARPS